MKRTFLALSVLLLSASQSGYSAPPSTAGVGTFNLRLDDDPRTLNPITYDDVYARKVLEWAFEPLLQFDDNTYKYRPVLAEKYEISPDGMTFTFTLRKGLKWQDGQPLTAEDVKYSFDVLFEGRFFAPHRRIFYEPIKEAKVLSPEKIQFIAKEPYFLAFEQVASLFIIPKHFYGVGDPKDPKFNRTFLGSGPYQLEEWNKGQRLVLKRWADYQPPNSEYDRSRNRFARIQFRPIREMAVCIEMLKKGDLDYLELRDPRDYLNIHEEEKPDSKFVTVKATNSQPSMNNYAFIDWNTKNPLFQDKRVRQALAHLINRDMMIEKFRFGMSEKANGPYGLRSPYSSKKVKALGYDPKKAKELFEQAGWKMGPQGLVKTIDGKETPFEFTLIHTNPDFEKYITLFQEDYKKAGVKMNVRLLEWNTFMKLVDERKFDAIGMGWTFYSLNSDLYQYYHSKSILAKGHNFGSFSKPEVDTLIEQIRSTMDEKKRWKLAHRLHEILADEQPYSYLFNPKYILYAANKRIKRPKDILKYGVGYQTWFVEQ
jgi:peptide/nickel transport system substrate-binding protein/microcin C transport system substrate-binding protein